MIRRLLVVDRYDSPAFHQLARAAAPDDACDVLLLGLNAEWLAWRHAGVLPAGGWSVIDPARFAEGACNQVAAFAVDVLAGVPHLDLGGTTLAGFLARAGRTDWWFAESSERGPYRGPLVGELYQLAMIQLVHDARAYDEMWFSIADPDLAAVIRTAAWPSPAVESPPAVSPQPTFLEARPLLRHWAQSVRAAALLAAAAVVSRIASRPLPSGGEATFTLFPAWWFGASTAAPRERFFAPRASSEAQWHLAWLTGGIFLWRHVAAIRQAFINRRIVPLQLFLGVRDALSIFSPAGFFRQIAFERRLRRLVRARLGRFEVGTLVGDDISRSLASSELVQDRLIERAVARAAVAMRPGRVIYRAEFQPIEHALLRGLEDGGAPVRLGFVHFPFGERYLSMRFARGETAASGRSTAGTWARPMPDALLAIGPAAMRHAIAGGFPAERVAVCGPQRYGPLQAAVRTAVSRPEARAGLGLPADRPLVLVALAILDADTQALCAALFTAAPALRDAVLMVRPHPNQPRDTGPVAALVEGLGPERGRLMPVDHDLYAVLRAADALVCIGSMVAFEAMALGVMPIVFENPATFPATSLREYDDGLFVVGNAGELHEALTAVWLDSPAARGKRARWNRVLQDVFADLERPLDEQMNEALQALALSTRSGSGAREERAP